MKINGSLVFDASSASVIENLRVQKYAGTAVPTPGAADVGRLIFVTTGGSVNGVTYTAATMYFGTASAWIPIATGGDAASLQNEVNAIEASLGAGIKGDGTFDATGFSDRFAQVLGGAPTTFTEAINKLATYADANNQLSELDDVTLASLADGQYLKYNATSSKWVNDTLQVADVTDLTATAAELNVLDGITSTTAELNILDGVTADKDDINLLDGFAAALTLANKAVDAAEFGYLDGVTSAIQTQLDDKQPLDATLTALAALTTGENTEGFVVQTGDDTFAKRSLVAPAAGITITNPAGIAGNATFALANDLAALEGLSTTGIIVRTADGAATTRSVAGTTGNIVVTNGSGVDGNPTLDLGSVTQANSGSFVKVTLDGFGRVTGNTAVTTADITTLVDATYVNVSGDTMTGNLNMGTNYVTMNSAPTQDTHAANKAYVDSVAAGLSWKQAVRAATTANINLAAPGATIDDVTLANGDRVLVKSQSAAAENGIYVFNGAAAAMTRATDMDTAGEFAGATVYVTEGTVNQDSGWTQTAEVATVGTTAVVWYQFSGSSTYTWGTGLDNTGNTIFVNLGAGIKELPTDQIGIDVAIGKAIQLTGTGTAAGDQLTFVLDAGSGMEQSATGLKISAGGVTNTMLANSVVAISGTNAGGDFDLALGGDLTLASAVNGLVIIDASGPGGGGSGSLLFDIRKATTSATGVASFSDADFSVASGVVTIKSGGVDNAQLANSTVTFAGNTGSDAVALGETFTFKDGGSHSTAGRLVDTTVGTNDVTIKVREATASLLGVASFDAAHFSVTAGAVSLAASLDDLNNVSSADAATTGDLLTKTAGDWQPVSRTTLMGSVVLDDIGDVAAGTAADGEVLVRNGSSQWVNQKVYHLETVTSAATTWTVTHNIGQKYCSVTIVDASDEVVIPQSITFDDANQLTVTFNTAIAGKVVVMGIA